MEECFHFRTDGLKIGTMVGTDQFGNRYYENKKFFIGILLHLTNILCLWLLWI